METQGEDSHEAAVTQAQAKAHQGLPAAPEGSRGQGKPFSRAIRESMHGC